MRLHQHSWWFVRASSACDSGRPFPAGVRPRHRPVRTGSVTCRDAVEAAAAVWTGVFAFDRRVGDHRPPHGSPPPDQRVSSWSAAQRPGLRRPPRTDSCGSECRQRRKCEVPDLRRRLASAGHLRVRQSPTGPRSLCQYGCGDACPCRAAGRADRLRGRSVHCLPLASPASSDSCGPRSATSSCL
jgi:hypothetical protein